MSLQTSSSDNRSSDRVAKRGRRSDFSLIKATVISIFITSSGIKMVKCSRYQRVNHACIVNPKNPSSYSAYVKDKKLYNFMGLIVEGVIRLSKEIRDTKAKR